MATTHRPAMMPLLLEKPLQGYINSGKSQVILNCWIGSKHLFLLLTITWIGQLFIENNELNKLYFIVETKGSIASKSRLPKEQVKIRSGEKHFDVLGNDSKF